MADAFLVDGNRGRQAFDLINVRLFHLAEELARVRAEAFDVAPLSLCVDGVERERGFAGAGEASDDDELVARNLQADVFEVVFARTANDEFIEWHCSYSPSGHCSTKRKNEQRIRKLKAKSQKPKVKKHMADGKEQGKSKKLKVKTRMTNSRWQIAKSKAKVKRQKFLERESRKWDVCVMEAKIRNARAGRTYVRIIEYYFCARLSTSSVHILR